MPGRWLAWGPSHGRRTWGDSREQELLLRAAPETQEEPPSLCPAEGIDDRPGA